MTLKLADPGAQGLFPTVEIPIVGGRHHGRFITAPAGRVNLAQENYIEGSYYTPHRTEAGVTLYPRRWFKCGLQNAIRMAEVHGPLLQNWPAVKVLGGIASGDERKLQDLELKAQFYTFMAEERWQQSPTGMRTTYQRYRFWQAESGTFYFIPHDWPEVEIPQRAAAAKILGRAA